MGILDKGQKMKGVYIVTRGEYSDYHIAAVFSDKEMANRFARDISRHFCVVEVEEYEIDEFANYPKDQRPFKVWLSPAGDLVKFADTDVLAVMVNSSVIDFHPGNEFGVVPHHTVYTFADNREHALKIASERLVNHKKESV